MTKLAARPVEARRRTSWHPTPEFCLLAPNASRLSNDITLNQTLEIINSAPKGKIGRRPGAFQDPVNRCWRKESCPEGVSPAYWVTVSEAGPNIHSLRQGRSENRRLEWALVLSLAIHLAGWGGYELGKRLGWWDHWPVIAWLHKTLHLTPPPVPAPPPPAVPTEPQLMFVEVPQPDPDPPKQAKYYANNNSHAANPDPVHNFDTPKLNGQQKDVPKTETARRTQVAKTVPQPQPQPPPKPEPSQLTPPPPALKPGDLTQGKPQEAQPHPQTPQPAHPLRPRTLKQAREQDPNHIAGVAMQQDGGAHRAAIQAFDAKATPFGDYDAQFVEAVTQKWYDLLDSQGFARDRTGHVTLHFNLNYDGSISDLTTTDQNVGPLYELLCQRALTEPAPFAKWPEEMRRMIGGTKREMTFTFFYY